MSLLLALLRSTPPTPPTPSPTGPRMFGGGRAWDKHWTTAEDMEDKARRTRNQQQATAAVMAFIRVLPS